MLPKLSWETAPFRIRSGVGTTTDFSSMRERSTVLPDRNTKDTVFFPERIGGNTQLVGSSDPGFDVVFEAEQPLLDAVFAITYGPHDPGPTLPKPDTAA